MSEEHRTKISNSKIFNRLLAYAEGEENGMTKAQADVALALMKKVMPDLQSLKVEGSGDDGEHKVVLSWMK